MRLYGLPGNRTRIKTGTVSILFGLLRVSSCRLKQSNIRRLALSIMSDGKEKKPFERLPTHVVPKNYGLVLEPDLEKFTFAGEETVDLDVGWDYFYEDVTTYTWFYETRVFNMRASEIKACLGVSIGGALLWDTVIWGGTTLAGMSLTGSFSHDLTFAGIYS